MHDREKEIERQIIHLTDHLIQACMSAGLLEDDIREHHVKQTANIVLKLSSLLMEVLPGREDYLYNLIQQLTAQRLPDKRVMESFSSFRNDLDAIIREGLLLYSQNKEQNMPFAENIPDTPKEDPKNVPETTSKSPETSEPVLQADVSACAPPSEEEPRRDNSPVFFDFVVTELHKCFPGTLILTNAKYRGTNVDYYLPDIKLILMRPGRLTKSYARLNYFAEIDAVTLIWLEEKDLHDGQGICRRVKKR